MHRPSSRLLTALALAGALGMGGCASGQTQEMAMTPTETTAMTTQAMTTQSMTTEAMTPTEEPQVEVPATGAYISLADYEADPGAREGTTVVLFFHAPWCPSCRATDDSLTASGVPDGLTVVKVDYDSETELRRQYGITQQHTFVQVDAEGDELARWTGSTTAAEIQAETA